MTVRIVTDSACDLPRQLADAREITLVPLTVRFGTTELVDGKDLTPVQFWSRLRGASTLPETAAPSVGAFQSVFDELAGDGASGIVCITLSSKLSATWQSAKAAASEVGCPVEVVDSKSISLGIGNLALAAAERAAQGLGLDDVVADVLDRRDRTRVVGVVDTLEYLRKGGRIGGAQALVGTMLSVKPVLGIDDGEVALMGKVRTRPKALQRMIDRIAGDTDARDLAVFHGDAADVDEFVERLTPLARGKDIVVSLLGPVVGTHTGPGTIGVAYLAD